MAAISSKKDIQIPQHLKAPLAGAAPAASEGLRLNEAQVASLQRFINNRTYLYNASLIRDEHCPTDRTNGVIHLAFQVPLRPFLSQLKRGLLEKEIPVRGVYMKGGAVNHIITGEMLKLSDLDLTIDIDKPGYIHQREFWNIVETVLLETLERYSGIRYFPAPTADPNTESRNYYDAQGHFLGTETVPRSHPPHLFSRLFGSRLKRTLVADEKNQYALHTFNMKIGGREQPIDIQFVERSEHNCLTSADSLYISLDEILENPEAERVAIKIVDGYDERAIELREKHQFVVHREGIETLRRGLQGFCRFLCRGYYPLWGDIEPRFWDTFMNEVRTCRIEKFSEELDEYLTKHYPDDPQGRLIYLFNFLAIIDRRSDLDSQHSDYRLKSQIRAIFVQQLCQNLGENPDHYTEQDLSEFLRTAHAYLFLLSPNPIRLEGDSARLGHLFFPVKRPEAEIYGNNYLFVPHPQKTIRLLRLPSESVLDHTLIKALARVFPHHEDNLNLFFAKNGAPEHPDKMSRETLLVELQDNPSVRFLMECIESPNVMKKLKSDLSSLSRALVQAAETAIDAHQIDDLDRLLKKWVAIPKLIKEESFTSLFTQLCKQPEAIGRVLRLYEEYVRANGRNIDCLNAMADLVERDEMETAPFFELVSANWTQDHTNRFSYENLLIRIFEKEPRLLPCFFIRNKSNSLLARCLESKKIVTEDRAANFLSNFTQQQMQRSLETKKIEEAAHFFHRAVQIRDLFSPEDYVRWANRFADLIRSDRKMAPPIFATAPSSFIRKVLLNHHDRFPHELFNSLTREQKISFFIDGEEENKRIDSEVIDRWIENAKVSDVDLVYQMVRPAMLKIKDRQEFLRAYFLFMKVLYPKKMNSAEVGFQRMIPFLAETKAPLEMYLLLAQHPEGLGDLRSTFVEIAQRHPEAAKMQLREAPPQKTGKRGIKAAPFASPSLRKEQEYIDQLTRLLEQIQTAKDDKLDLIYRLVEQVEIGMKTKRLPVDDSRQLIHIGSICIDVMKGIKPLSRLCHSFRTYLEPSEWINLELTFIKAATEISSPFEQKWGDKEERVNWILDRISLVFQASKEHIRNPAASSRLVEVLLTSVAELSLIDRSPKFKSRLTEKLKEIFSGRPSSFHEEDCMAMAACCSINPDFRSIAIQFSKEHPMFTKDFDRFMLQAEADSDRTAAPIVEACLAAKSAEDWKKAFRMCRELKIPLQNVERIFEKKQNWQMLGLLYYNSQRYHEAVSIFHKAHNLTKDSLFLKDAGDCYTALNDIKRAIACFSLCAFEMISDRENNRLFKSSMSLIKQVGAQQAIERIEARKSDFYSSSDGNIYHFVLGTAYAELREESKNPEDQVKFFNLSQNHFSNSVFLSIQKKDAALK